jgi:uncharacterized protein YjbI with pentapeptide repeats
VRLARAKDEKSKERICAGYKDKQGKCENSARFTKVSPYCSNCAGASFEDQVARLFRVQGYQVYQNLSLTGTQHDFFAVLEFGFVTTGILVECKWKFKEDGKVNSEDVRKFYASFTLFNNIGTYGRAQHAYLVTSNKLAPEAVEVAKGLNITVCTHQDLVKRLIKLEPYLDSIIKQYKDSRLDGHYIELKTTNGDFLARQVIQKLRSSNAVVVLGDYGTGKTSFCLKLCSELANGISQGKQVPLPIYIQLKDYAKAINMDSLITNLLINNCRIHNASIHTFRELLESMDVILVFDGFDEIARRVDYTVKFKVFNEICKFATESTKILVTCRPNFFNQKDEFIRIFKNSPLYFEPTSTCVEFSEVELGDLNVLQIKKYIRSYENELLKNGLDYNAFINILDKIHDLWDLAKRPVLLNVIIETIPRIRVTNTNQKINATSLYDTYTRFWLDREDSKGKTLIRASEKVNFTRQLARKMFNSNTLTINHRDLPEEVNKYFNVSDPENLEHYGHDIRSCSFLNMDEKGDYKFIHKSFMEYFVAGEIISELREIRNASNEVKSKRLNNLLGECLLSLEIGLFIRDLVENGDLADTDIKALRIEELSNLKENTLKNLISIQTKVSSDAQNCLKDIKDLEGVDLSYIKLDNMHLQDINFDGAIMYNSEISNTSFINCSMVNTVFRKSTIIKSKFSGCKCETSDFSNVKLRECTFPRSNFAYSKFNDSSFEKCDFYKAELTEIKYNEHTQVKNCKYIETTIGTPYDEKWPSK